MKELKDYRQSLDKIDKELKRLLDERFSISIAIGELKRANGMEIFDPEREKEILQTQGVHNESAYNEATMEVYKVILEESKKLQKNL